MNTLQKIFYFFIIRLFKLLSVFGIYLKNHQDDRIILEDVIFPYFINNDQIIKIVFVGVAWYTRQYNRVFKHKQFWTVDFDPRVKKYGSRRHIVDSIENLDRHFRNNEIDLIICNGVFGWGLNNKANIEKSFQVCFDILKNKGIFILGWNDLPEYRPIDLKDINSLNSFNPLIFEPLGVAKYLTGNPNRHTFNFYIKPE